MDDINFWDLPFPKLWTFMCQMNKSKSHYDRWSVSQSDLVLRPSWVSWPDINYWLTFTVLLMSGAPSDKRLGLSFFFYWNTLSKYDKIVCACVCVHARVHVYTRICMCAYEENGAIQEVVNCHYFWTLLYNVPTEMTKKIRKDWNWM
jgi:hypothetical protein